MCSIKKIICFAVAVSRCTFGEKLSYLVASYFESYFSVTFLKCTEYIIHVAFNPY